VVQRVPLRVVLGALLDPLQRLEQHPVELEAVEWSSRCSTSVQVELGSSAFSSASSSAIEARSIALPVIELLKT
jgi:hypothetical protein